LSACVNIGIVIVIYMGGLRVIGGGMTTGEIVAFVNYLQTTVGPLLIMVNLANVWAAGIVSAERINEILDTIPEIQEQPNAQKLIDSQGLRIVFENVSFQYNGSADTIVL